jgi:hypothetical protein
MRWRPDSPSIYLPNSGQIDLNAIGMEAGYANTQEAGLNYAAIRGLIGKASGAQNAMDEYYGASSSDAITSTENFGNSYFTGFFGFKTPSDSGSGFDTNVRNRGEYVNATPMNSNEHYWAQGADGKPHAFTSANPSYCDSINTWSTKIPYFYNKMGSQVARSSQWSQYTPNWWTMQYNMGTGAENNPGTYSEQWQSCAMQRLAPGTWRLEGRCKYGPGKTNGRTHQMTVYLMEIENMVDAGNYLSKGSGQKKQTQLWAGPESSTALNGPGVEVTWTATFTNTYEWCYLNTFSRCNSYSSRNDLVYLNSITPVT